MKDEELLVLMPQISELTDSAQQALVNEFRSRGLKAEAAAEKPSVPPTAKPPAFVLSEPAQFHDAYGYDSSGVDSPDEESAYDADRRLVELCTVWSLRDAAKVQAILEGAGIPFLMGTENAASADAVTSNFTKGVSVKIMRIGMRWAMPLMQHYEPEDDPTPPQPGELEESPVRCPKCQSTDVVFEGREDEKVSESDEAPEKFKWTCDACGNQWEDDGVAKEE